MLRKLRGVDYEHWEWSTIVWQTLKYNFSEMYLIWSAAIWLPYTSRY